MTDVRSRAQLLIAAARHQEAARLLGAHLAADPGDSDALRLLGWAQLGALDTDGALRSVRALISQAPGDVDSQLLAAVVHAACREIALAQQAARTAIRLAPTHPAPYRVAAGVDIDCGLVTDATVMLARQAIELDPQDADAHRLAGTALLELRRRKEAGEYLRRAAALDPESSSTAAELARWQAHRGAGAAAARGFAAVVQADPTDRLALQNLNATVWHTFSIAQLVLWAAMAVLGRARLLVDGDPAGWVHLVGPITVSLTLGAWGYQLRGAWRLGPMMRVVRTDRTLQIGLAAHVLCLVTLIVATLLPDRPGELALLVGIALVLTATATVWIRQRQQKRTEEHPANPG